MPTRPQVLRPARLGAPTTRTDQRREYEAKRREEKPWRALYKTARWQAIRGIQLASEPLCRMCTAEGKTVVATVCDHVERHNGDERRFFAGPFQSLCTHCHNSVKKRAEQAAIRF